MSFHCMSYGSPVLWYLKKMCVQKVEVWIGGWVRSWNVWRCAGGYGYVQGTSSVLRDMGM